MKLEKNSGLVPPLVSLKPPLIAYWAAIRGSTSTPKDERALTADTGPHPESAIVWASESPGALNGIE